MKDKIIVGIVLILFIFFTAIFLINKKIYVTSKYSKYCYSVDDVNPNIKEKVYYKGLSSCGKPKF